MSVESEQVKRPEKNAEGPDCKPESTGSGAPLCLRNLAGPGERAHTAIAADKATHVPPASIVGDANTGGVIVFGDQALERGVDKRKCEALNKQDFSYLPKDKPIDAAGRKQAIATLVHDLNDKYVFPDVAKKIETGLRKADSKGEFDGITSSVKFAQRLTEKLRKFGHDEHLQVAFNQSGLPEGTKLSDEQIDKGLKEQACLNSGVSKAKMFGWVRLSL